MIGKWVTDTLEKKKRPKENGGSPGLDSSGDDIEKPKPPLHSVVTENPL